MARTRKTNNSPSVVEESPLPAPTGPIDRKECQLIIDMTMDKGITAALKFFRRTNQEFFCFVLKDPELEAAFHQGQKIRAEVGIDESVYLADHEKNIDRAKLKIMTRQWMAERLLPKKYGNKVSVDHTHTVDIRGSIEEARRRAGVFETTGRPVTQIDDKESIIREREAHRAIDMRASLAFVPPPMPNENPVAWAVKQVESLPLENQPISVEEAKAIEAGNAAWKEDLLKAHAVKALEE